MTAMVLNNKQRKIIEEIPSIKDFSSIYFYLIKSDLDVEYVAILDRIIGLKDNILSKWLSISPGTFRNYKNNSTLKLKNNIKEHIVLILSLYKHGIEVFDDIESFESWLSGKNSLLDNKAPIDFLDTISGIKFIDNQLTGIEFGENV